MSKEFIENIHYKGENFTEKPLKMAEYENCTFSNCIFYEANLSDTHFTDCEFDNCDLSMAKLYQTAFKEVIFKNCKLLGLRFDHCNSFLLSFNFNACTLNFSSFYQLKLKNTHFLKTPKIFPEH